MMKTKIIMMAIVLVLIGDVVSMAQKNNSGAKVSPKDSADFSLLKPQKSVTQGSVP